MKTVPLFFLKGILSVVFLFQISTVCSQALCSEGCAVNDNCADLAVSGGLCLGSPTFFCEGETVCVNNNSDPDSFDEWVVWWDDGASCDIFPNTVTEAYHVYDISQDTCLENIVGLSRVIYIKNIKYCGSEPEDYSLNCIATFIKIKVNPVANYDKPQAICKGEEACFTNMSCMNADTAFYEWYVDGTLITEMLNFCYIFPTVGFYDVCLVATNECGVDSLCQTVNVIDVPVALSAYSYIGDSCIDATVELYDQSIGPAFISWEVVTGGNYQFIPNDDTSYPDTTVVLLDSDSFNIMHIASNFCGTDTSFVLVPAFGVPGISIEPSGPICDTIYFPDVTYINSFSIDTVKWVVDNSTDTIYDFYPQIILSEGDHIIEVIALGPCGIATEIVPITVNLTDSIIFNPIDVLCVDSDPILLEVILVSTGEPVPLSMGTFSCINPLFIDNGFFNPTLAGTGTYTICFETSNSLCPGFTSIDIVVSTGEDVQVGDDEEICIDAGELQLVFSPPGGEWSGDGVTDPVNGIFDPMVAGGGLGGIFILEYRFEDTAGCVTYKNKEITVVELPVIEANDVSICKANMEFDITVLAGPDIPSNVTCFIDGIAGCLFNPDTMVIGSYEVIFTASSIVGCSKLDTITLEITELLLVMAPPDTTVCAGDALTLIGTPSSCAIWSPSPFIDINNGNVNTNGFAGGQTFTITCNAGTVCETSDEVTVTVISEGAQVLPVEDWVCGAQAAYILPDGTPNDGQWFGDFLTGNEVDISQLAADSSYTYDYTVSYLPDACETASFILNVAAPPIAGFTNPQIGCVGVEVEFNNVSTGATHFFWDFGNNLTDTLQDPTIIYDAIGDYMITLEIWTEHPVSGDVLCIETFTDTIHISQPPQNVEIGTNSFEGCGPLELDFTNLSSGENMNYQWQIINLQTTNVDSINGASPGTIVFEQTENETTFYDVILKGWNDCDTLVDTIQIAVFPDPTADFGIQFDEPCSGGDLILNNLSVGNPLNNTWTITNITLNTPSSTFSSINPPPITVYAPDTAQALVLVQLETSNECGTSIYTDTVYVQPSPIIAQMSYSAEQLCIGDTLMLSNISTPGTNPVWEIIQSNQAPFFFNGDVLNFAPTIAGSFTVILRAYGCGYDSISLEFEALPLPELSVTFDPEVPCQGNPVHFEVTSTVNGLKLYYGDGDSTDLHNSDHVYTEAGLFLLSATVQNPFGCQNEWADSITIAETPTNLAMNFTDEICVGTPSEFVGLGTGVQSWEWAFCDSCFRSGNTVSYTFDTFGLHNVQLVGVSPLGCRDTIYAPFFVKTTPEAILDYDLISDCTPAEIIFNNLSLDATGIEWQANNGQTSLDNSITIIQDEAGMVIVQLIATNGDICFDTTFASIPIAESPAFTVSLNENCTISEGTSVLVEADLSSFVTLSGTNYEADGYYHQHVPPGDYVVEVISVNGCIAEEEIVVIPIQELFIQLDQYLFEIDLGEEAHLDVISNLSDVTYSWSPAVDLNNPTISNPIVNPIVSTFYAVAVTDERECVKYDTAYVKVNIDRENNIFIPNTFTPNYDGTNDIFRIRSLNPGLTNINSFEIFDRFGEKVYEAYDCEPETSTCGWDGTFKGQKAEMGLYIWMTELEFFDGVSLKRTGGVTLLR